MERNSKEKPGEKEIFNLIWAVIQVGFINSAISDATDDTHGNDLR